MKVSSSLCISFLILNLRLKASAYQILLNLSKYNANYFYYKIIGLYNWIDGFPFVPTSLTMRIASDCYMVHNKVTRKNI